MCLDALHSAGEVDSACGQKRTSGSARTSFRASRADELRARRAASRLIDESDQRRRQRCRSSHFYPSTDMGLRTGNIPYSEVAAYLQRIPNAAAAARYQLLK